MKVLKVKSNSVVCFTDNSGRSATEFQREVLAANWKKIDYTGNISVQTRKKIVNMLSLWSDAIFTYNSMFDTTEGRRAKSLKFLTLTISKATTLNDNEAKRKLLMPFIQVLQSKFGVGHYFWRAEAQENGNIHFHLIIDAWCDKSAVNFAWDCAQYNAGIIEVKPVYKEKYQTPSTRIEGCKSTGHVEAYVVKYCLKDEKNRKIEGRVWGCSDSLRELKPIYFLTTQEVVEEFTKIVEKTKPEVFEGNHFKIYFIDLLRNKNTNDSWLKTELEATMLQNFKILYNNDIQIQ